MSRRLLVTVGALLALARSAAAQGAEGDVELLGQVYGTRPPPAYYALKARDPNAFQFRSGWMRRANAPARVDGVGPGGGAARILGPRGAAVEGTFHFPLLLVLFQDSPELPPFPRQTIQNEFFDGPNGYYKTIPEFYAELSGGRVELVGHTHGWVRSSLTQAAVAANQSALPGRIGEYVLQAVAAVDDGTVDWGLYDNDGPDGVPNSGDDDGFVDILALMHPTTGAECDGSTNRIWSHKWNLQSATGQTYVTRSPSAHGGFVRINDYTVQPTWACGNVRINQIGVFAHELGHAFGLPDLYCTASSCSHSGIGRWGLMGSGAWGCAPPPANRPDRPCMMSAWERATLGWVEVVTLSPDQDLGTLTLGPVETDGRVFRIDAADGSGDYFLLENRQPIGFDSEIAAPGLLAWRIDQDALDERWPTNSVNNDRNRMAIFLLQADGRNDLATTRCGFNCGDAGDPFPGASGKDVLHTGSVPSTRSHFGTPSGLTLLDIRQVGADVTFRALTRFQQIRLRAVGSSAAGGLLSVDGQALPGPETVVRAAPFQTLLVEAAGGVPVSDGVRLGFAGWADDPELGRSRTFVTGLEDAELVAEYGNRREIRLRATVHGDRFGVSAGRIVTTPESPDGWFPEGTPVSLRAEATTGFAFVRWTGAVAGQSNPAVVQMDAPVDVGAEFELTYRFAGELTHTLEAASPQEIVLHAENGSLPVTWTLLDGRLPHGLDLRPDGLIYGAAMQTGEFPLTLQAVDASGLIASGTVTLVVGRPAVGVQSLVGVFLGNASALTDLQKVYLDTAGNRNGVYDLGDLRAFFLANRDLPLAASERALIRTLLPTVIFEPRREKP